MAAMRQVLPMGHLARDVVRNPADREVGVGISHHHGDIDVGVDLSGPECRTDPRVASTDGDQVALLLLGSGHQAGRRTLLWVPLDWGEAVCVEPSISFAP